MIDFREYLRKKVLNPSQRILEFGPLIRPIVTKETHPNIRFADIRSTEEVKALYTSNDYLKSTGLSVDTGAVVDIDYVVKGSYKDTFKSVEKFDVVILSHVIEHMPDIVEFFLDIRNTLRKGGKLVLIYPDARYCFDHFRNGSTFADAYSVYENKENDSTRVLDFVNNVVNENDAAYFWNNESQNDKLPTNDFKKTLKDFEKAKKGVLPEDTHFWPFADYQFVKFLYDLDRASFLDFTITKFEPTQENTQEFMVILTYDEKRTINPEVYKKLLKELSPTNKEIRARNTIANLTSRVTAVEEDLARVSAANVMLQNELDAIYQSKKWKYSTKASDLLHAPGRAISGGDDKKDSVTKRNG